LRKKDRVSIKKIKVLTEITQKDVKQEVAWGMKQKKKENNNH
jgi:hypothetical protein